MRFFKNMNIKSLIHRILTVMLLSVMIGGFSDLWADPPRGRGYDKGWHDRYYYDHHRRHYRRYPPPPIYAPPPVVYGPPPPPPGISIILPPIVIR